MRILDREGREGCSRHIFAYCEETGIKLREVKRGKERVGWAVLNKEGEEVHFSLRHGPAAKKFLKLTGR